MEINKNWELTLVAIFSALHNNIIEVIGFPDNTGLIAQKLASFRRLFLWSKGITQNHQKPPPPKIPKSTQLNIIH